MTFTIARGGVKTTRVDNGRLVFDLSEPFTFRDAQQSHIVFMLPDDKSREQVTTWIKVKK